MFALLPLMLDRIGVLLIIVIVLSRVRSFRHLVRNRLGMGEKLALIAVFGAFGIISNYTGIEIRGNQIYPYAWLTGVSYDGAIANTRVLGVALGGLLGGPFVGLGVGMIAGVHRIMLGGYTGTACGISTIMAGIVTGLIGGYYRNRKGTAAPWLAAVIGIMMECAQMGVILLWVKPFEASLQLVQIIGIPMIVINGFGTLLFMLIVQSMLQEEERTSALQTHKALYIADQTLPYFRKGLNPDSCREAALIIMANTNADAISITDRHRVLAHIGAGANHHVPLESLSTQLTRNVLEQGEILKVTSAEQIGCMNQNCPLQAAFVLPLKIHHKTVGTLKMYFTHPSRMNQVEQELAEGLSKLISNQLEWADAEVQSRLLKDAEVKALQAQVHPHFLFNAINTISALCRTDSDKARQLLLNLGVFFRSNLQGARQTLIPLYKELEHVEAYLQLEQARFPDKYTIRLVIDPSLEQVLIPPFTLQPLVENAIKHAFSSAVDGVAGHVSIHAYEQAGRMVLITEDNGQGISAERVESLGREAVSSLTGTGTALVNIRRRIDEIYNGEAELRIESARNAGTKVIIAVPLRYGERGGTYVESLHRR